MYNIPTFGAWVSLYLKFELILMADVLRLFAGPVYRNADLPSDGFYLRSPAISFDLNFEFKLKKGDRVVSPITFDEPKLTFRQMAVATRLESLA